MHLVFHLFMFPSAYLQWDYLNSGTWKNVIQSKQKIFKFFCKQTDSVRKFEGCFLRGQVSSNGFKVFNGCIVEYLNFRLQKTWEKRCDWLIFQVPWFKPPCNSTSLKLVAGQSSKNFVVSKLVLRSETVAAGKPSSLFWAIIGVACVSRRFFWRQLGIRLRSQGTIGQPCWR